MQQVSHSDWDRVIHRLLDIHKDEGKYAVNIPTLISQWLSYFPLKKDKEEIKNSVDNIWYFIKEYEKSSKQFTE